MIIPPQTWWSIQHSIWLPTALKRQLSSRAGRRRKREQVFSCLLLFLFSSAFCKGISQVKCTLHDRKDTARKEFSLSKQNKHTSIAQHNRVSNRYLHEFATFVLHPTLNYGPFNFTITDNGGEYAENQRLSSAVLRKWEKGTMKPLPTRCLSLSQPLWVLLGGVGENQGCPGSWSLGNETSGWKV